MSTLLFYYIATINLVTFATFGYDKWQAKRRKWRISERTLLGLAAIGGSAGAWIGMLVFRHKTRHKKFCMGVPALLFLQVIITMAIWTN